MKLVDILGLRVGSFTKKDFLESLAFRIDALKKTFIVTANPEGVMLSLKNRKFKDAVNSADYITADGAGLIWASYLLDRKVSHNLLRYLTIPVYSFFSLVLFSFHKRLFYRIIPERIAGSDIFWDILKIASKKDKTVFLLGGFDGVAEKVAKKIKNKFPHIRIVGVSEKNPTDKGLVSEINKTGADFLFIAWGQPKQEVWIKENLNKLNSSLAVGIGGTFDFVAGTRKRAPKFFRKVGLEWFWRLFIEPKRIKRIFAAVPKFVYAVCREKILNPKKGAYINGSKN